MPYTPKQHRLFEAAAHSPSIAKSSGIPQATAKTMASEGIKRAPKVAAPTGPKTVAPKHNKNTVLASALMKGPA